MIYIFICQNITFVVLQSKLLAHYLMIKTKSMRLNSWVMATIFLGINSITYGKSRGDMKLEDASERKIIKRFQHICISRSNSEELCDCVVNSFNQKITNQDRAFLLMPTENATIYDLPKIQAIKDKFNESTEDCGADFSYY